MSGIKIRQRVEREIVTAAIDSLLKSSYTLNTDYGDGMVLDSPTGDRAAILTALFQGDDDRIYVYENFEPKPFAWVWAVYGNDGYDVISDYTVNLEPIIGEGTPVQAVIDSWAD